MRVPVSNPDLQGQRGRAHSRTSCCGTSPRPCTPSPLGLAPYLLGLFRIAGRVTVGQYPFTELMSEAEILEDFPDLQVDDIRAALAFAAEGERRIFSAS